MTEKLIRFGTTKNRLELGKEYSFGKDVDTSFVHVDRIWVTKGNGVARIKVEKNVAGVKTTLFSSLSVTKDGPVDVLLPLTVPMTETVDSDEENGIIFTVLYSDKVKEITVNYTVE